MSIKEATVVKTPAQQQWLGDISKGYRNLKPTKPDINQPKITTQSSFAGNTNVTAILDLVGRDKANSDNESSDDNDEENDWSIAWFKLNF